MLKKINKKEMEKEIENILKELKEILKNRSKYLIPECEYEQYLKYGLMLKTIRLHGDILAGTKIKRDTLIDLIGYSVLYNLEKK